MRTSLNGIYPEVARPLTASPLQLQDKTSNFKKLNSKDVYFGFF